MMLFLLFSSAMINLAFSLECSDDNCTCPSGETVNRNVWCDGKPDCSDHYDEADETCKFLCNDTANTIVNRIRDGFPAQVCDGVEDCPNGDDEMNCEFTKLYTCGDGNVITQHQLCDDINDCTDGLDEFACNKGCENAPTPTELMCTKLNITPSIATVMYTEENGDQVSGNASIICNGITIGQFACTDGIWIENCRSGSSCWSYLSDVSKGYYKPLPIESSFGLSQGICASNCGQLITVHSLNEANHAVQLFQASNPGSFLGTWIGMTRGPGGSTETNAQVQWIDGTPVTYQGPYGSLDPSCDGCADCLCLNCMEILVVDLPGVYPGQWNDQSCGASKRGPSCAFYIEGNLATTTVQTFSEPITPFQLNLTGGVHTGQRFVVIGTPTSNCDSIEINFLASYDGADNAFHFRINLPLKATVPNTIVCDTRISNVWQGQENPDIPFPFKCDQMFTLVFVCQENGFEVTIDGANTIQYNHKIAPENIVTFVVEGDVDLQQIRVEE